LAGAEARPQYGEAAARSLAQVVTGRSTELGELVGPVTWCVGKWCPETTRVKVKEVLTKLAKKCGVVDFAVESVQA
jgi:hypothetical protein